MGADPTWPNRARCSIPCDITLGSGGGGGATGSVRCRCGPRERVSFCHVFSLSVSLLFLFPSVCCSFKLPLSRPTSFCLFLSILLRTPVGGGAAAWCFCCRQQLKPKHFWFCQFGQCHVFSFHRPSLVCYRLCLQALTA